MAILNDLKKPKGPYEFKGVGSPEYYLGGDVTITYHGNSISELMLSSQTYIKRICDKIEDLMGLQLKGFMNPMDPNYHAEIDDLYFLVDEDIFKYRMMVGSLNWQTYDDAKGRSDACHEKSVWVSEAELQNCVETSTFGTEIVAGRIAVDLAVEL
eukprot:15365683-Ditylum_brightwellii.AAC.1